MYDYKNTYTLLNSVKELPPLHTFLLDRYFPTSARDIFTTDEVIVEYKKGSKKAAPFVAPRHGGVVVLRDGYKLRSFAPAHTGVKRSLTIDDLKLRGFGEALYPDLTPEQREGALILEDLDDMRDMIARRKEAMAAEVIFTNGFRCCFTCVSGKFRVNDTGIARKFFTALGIFFLEAVQSYRISSAVYDK